MRISYNWLKDYIATKIPPEELAKKLTMAGLAVESVERTAGDHILELEVTSNRPDWLSYIGVARELAAITGSKLKIPRLAQSSLACKRQKPGQAKLPGLQETRARTGKAQSKRGAVKVGVEDKKLCPRYTARIITDVKVEESPAHLKTRLEAIGVRSGQD